MATRYKDTVVANAGLVSLFPEDESSGAAIDAMGVSNGEAFAPLERAQASLLPSGEGNSCKFTGGTFIVADKAALRVGDIFSLECIFCPEELGKTQALISGGSGCAELRLSGGNKLQLLKNNIASIVESTVAVEKNIPYYVVCTKNGSTAKLYLANLSTVSFADVTGTVTNATCEALEKEWRLGQRGSVGDDVYKGKQQFAAIYNVALSQATAEAHFNAAFRPATPFPRRAHRGLVMR